MYNNDILIKGMDKRLSSPTPKVDVNPIIRKSQTRVWKALEGEPEFILSVVETQSILNKFAKSKINFVILWHQQC